MEVLYPRCCGLDVHKSSITACVLQDHPVVLSVGGSRVSLQGPCNRLVGEYQITGTNQLTVNAAASTKMACDPALMQADSILFNLLAKPLQVQMNSRPSAQLQLSVSRQRHAKFQRRSDPGIAVRGRYHGLSRNRRAICCLPESAVAQHSLSAIPRTAL